NSIAIRRVVWYVISGMQAWLLVALLVLGAFTAPAQNAPAKLNPVTWKLEFAEKTPPGGVASGKLTATIEPPWHLYSITTPKGGPNPTQVGLAPNEAVESVEVFQPKPDRKFDPNFSLDTETFEHEAVFYLRVTLKKTAPPGPLELTAQM